MIKSAMITECWTPQSNRRDVFFLYIHLLLLEDGDIVQLIASIGPRRKLIAKRKTVIDIEQNLSSEVCSHKNN